MNVNKGSIYIETSIDLQDEIRRGDGIYINNKMYRVNADTTSTNKKLYSLSSITDINKTLQEKEKYKFLLFKFYRAKIDGTKLSTKIANVRVDYKYEYTSNKLPLDRPYEGNSERGVIVYKEGLTNDIRDMWFKLETGNMTYNRIEDEMKRNSI